METAPLLSWREKRARQVCYEATGMVRYNQRRRGTHPSGERVEREKEREKETEREREREREIEWEKEREKEWGVTNS